MNYLTISSCVDAISQGWLQIKAITSLMHAKPQNGRAQTKAKNFI